MKSSEDKKTLKRLKEYKIKNDELKIVGTSQCTVSVVIDKKISKKTGVDFFYYLEYFTKNEEKVRDFLLNLTFINYSSEYGIKSDRIITLNAKGKNTLIIFYKRLLEEYNDSYEFGLGKSICKLTKYIVNIIYDKNNITNSFLYHFFDFPEEYTWINDSNMIMIPDFGKFYTDNNIMESMKISNYIERKQLYESTFIIYVKPSNYVKLKKIYKEYKKTNDRQKMEYINKKIKKSNYRHIFYLRNNVNQFKEIYATIINFFSGRYEIPIDDIHIQVPLYEIRYKLMWMRIFVTFRNIKDGYYDIRRFIQSSNSISLNELIDILNICVKNKKTVGDYLEGKYGFYISNKMIEDYEIDLKKVTCKNDIRTTFSVTNTQFKKRFNLDKKMLDNNKKIIERLTIVKEMIVKDVIFRGTYKDGILNGKLLINNNSKINGVKITDNLLDIELKKCEMTSTDYEHKKEEGIDIINIKEGEIRGNIKSVNKGLNMEYTWHKKLIKKNMINKKIKVLRVLPFKSPGYNSACGTSSYCEIEDNYYIINIIPRTSAYIIHNKDDKNFNIFDYIVKRTNGIINGYNNDYFGESVIHDSLYYLVEIINISPVRIEECEILDNEPHINKSIILSKEMIHIKLDENYEIGKQLIECYKRNFGMKIFLIIYNILRNLYSYKKEKWYEKLEGYVFKKLEEIERVYIESINKEHNEKTRVIKNIIENYKEGNIIGSNDSTCPFTCVPSREYKKNNISSIKFVIWYTPLDLTKKDIKDVLKKILNMCYDRRIKYDARFPMFYTLDYIELNRDMVREIYMNISEFNDDYFENYIFNVCCLMGTNGFVKEKYQLDIMINEISKYYNIEEDHYALYHYITVTPANTLHIHIYTSATSTKLESFSSINKIGYENLDMHEYTKYYFLDYKKIIYELWKENHPFMITVPCATKLRRYTDKYIVENKRSFTTIIYELMFKKEYIDKDYYIVSEFILRCNDIKSETILYKYFYYLSEYECGKKYCYELIKYRNNLKIFIRNLYYIINKLS